MGSTWADPGPPPGRPPSPDFAAIASAVERLVADVRSWMDRLAETARRCTAARRRPGLFLTPAERRAFNARRRRERRTARRAMLLSLRQARRRRRAERAVPPVPAFAAVPALPGRRAR